MALCDTCDYRKFKCDSCLEKECDELIVKHNAEWKEKQDKRYQELHEEYKIEMEKIYAEREAAFETVLNNYRTLRNERLHQISCSPFIKYASFKTDRIREPITAEEQIECRMNPTTSRRIRLVFGAWRKENNIDGLTANDVLFYMTKEFGKPQKEGLWPTVKVFATDQDVLEWEADHDA